MRPCNSNQGIITMNLYTDGFVVPVPKRKLKAYLKMARQAAKIWREYGGTIRRGRVLWFGVGSR